MREEGETNGARTSQRPDHLLEERPRRVYDARADGFTHEVSARARERIADTLDMAAERAVARASEARIAGGATRHTAWVGDHAAGRLHGAAEYVRQHGAHAMRRDLERSVRAHPLRTIAIAFGVGYLFGKLR